MDRLDLARYEGHTPGNWWWADDSCVMAKGAEILRPVCVDGRMELSHDGDYFEVGSNRALIADAPTLLSALGAAYAEIDRLTSGGWVKVKDAPPEWAAGDHCMILCENGERVWWSDMGYPSESDPGPGWFYEVDPNYYERCDPEWRLFRVPCPPEEDPPA